MQPFSRLSNDPATGELTMPALLAACEATLAIAFKYEVQYWLDAPGTDAEKLAQIVGVMRDAIAAAKGSPQ